MVSRSKSSWSSPTFQRFSPELSQQSTKSRKFQFQIAFSVRNKWNQVGSVWDLLKETPWKSFPLEFSAPTQEEKRVHFPRRVFGWCIYIHVPKSWKNPQQCLRVSKIFVPPTFWLIEVANWLISCISMWLGIFYNSAPSLWLNWGGRGWCVKIAWMIKKAYFRWRLWFVVSQ